jgi:hypothetical protein
VNPLNDYPAARKALYTVQYVVSGVMLLLGVAYGALEDVGVPEWYVVTSAVLSALWAYTGVTAAQNVHTAVTPPAATTGPDNPDDTLTGGSSGRQEADGQLALFEVDEATGEVM